MTPWWGLAVRLTVFIGAAVLLVAFDEVLSLRVDPLLAFLAAVVLAGGSWVFTHLAGPDAGPEWQQPSWHTRSPHFQADVRTRRLASTLVHSQPGQAFDARRVARQLSGLAVRRLVDSGRIPAPGPGADPLADAQPHLSAALLAYLRSADGDRPQPLNRRTLHAHLKEIDSL
ncbi:hypothetical protein [Tessaracoccus sp. G1721]